MTCYVTFLWMCASRATTSRLSRLEELKGLLKSRDIVVAENLASELGVSRRTLHRDLEILREAGVPIESGRGRGGGLRLHPNWGLGRVHFSAAEAIDLLLSIAIAEHINSPVLLRQLASIKRKIVASFGETHQAQIRLLRKRILLGPPASGTVTASLENSPRRAHPALAEAFLNSQRVVIEYVDRTGVRTRREVEPHYLYLMIPAWYVLAWDRLREAVRHFRVDRITSVTPTGQTFRLADPQPFIAQMELEITAL
jgi:predicted DNA-binding transcriptional regulator YafY